MPELGAPRTTITELDVPIAMRDGTTLRALVVRPTAGYLAPVLLMRTPYPFDVVKSEVDLLAPARRGIALVVVSTRGTGTSEGTFEPWGEHDRVDGADTIAWCAEQPWSSGHVVTWGRSYLAQTQLYAAAEAPPALRAMAMGVLPTDPYTIVYSQGVLNLGTALNWAIGMTGFELARRQAAGEDMTAEQQEWLALILGMPEAYRTTPLADIAPLDRVFPAWRTWLEHPARDDFWAARAIPPRPALPSLIIGGWYDIFLNGSLAEFAKTPRHPDTRLIVGPWSHGSANSALGDVDYGFAASGAAAGLDAQVLDFLLSHLSSEPESPPAAPVRLFLTGANRWVDRTTWPPVDVTDTDLFLHSRALRFQPPTVEEPSTPFDFDPRNPVPTLGGANLMPAGDAANLSGSVDQRPLDDRTDIARFSSEPLTQDLEVVGPVRLTLHAATSARDTDWTAKLIDVHPDGTAFNLTDGVVRARHRDPKRPELLTPNQPHEFLIELGAIGHVFLVGHRIRLDVSSSNFPRYDRNPGTGADPSTAHETDFVIAHQRLIHNKNHPSRLTLPIAPAARVTPMVR